MSIQSKGINHPNFTIFIKKQAQHLLSNPVFYNHNPPQVQKAVIDVQASRKVQIQSLNNPNNHQATVTCSTCINKDLEKKKIESKEDMKRKDQEIIKQYKRRACQKEERQKKYKRDKKQHFRKELDQHTKLHSEQKNKLKQRDIKEQAEIISIMKSEVLRVEKRQERLRKERSISQLSLKEGLDNQLKSKAQKQKQLLQYKKSKDIDNPKCIPAEPFHKSRNSFSSSKYKLDLDEMIKEKQRAKRNQSKQALQKQRLRLLKVIEKEQCQEKKVFQRKEMTKKQETEVMVQNILEQKNRQDTKKRIHKQNQQPIKVFFDQEKRRVRQNEKRNIWKNELREAMKQSTKPPEIQSIGDSRRSSTREFSNYRSVEKSSSVSNSNAGLKIVINNDKVCCSNCHEVKPLRSVGNYVFGK